MKRLVADDAKSAAIKVAITDRNVSKAPLSEKEKLAMVYAQALTSTPPKATESMVVELRNAGLAAELHFLTIVHDGDRFSHRSQLVVADDADIGRIRLHFGSGCYACGKCSDDECDDLCFHDVFLSIKGIRQNRFFKPDGFQSNPLSQVRVFA